MGSTADVASSILSSRQYVLTCASCAPPLQVNPADVVIIEGILVFHDTTVRSHFNMKIFVDTGG